MECWQKSRYKKGCAGVYRYGFNGKEKDVDGEWGSNTHYDYGFRIYNPSIGKFLSVDPLTKSYPWYTPYQFASNRPIVAIDIDGLESGDVNNEKSCSDPNEIRMTPPIVGSPWNKTSSAQKQIAHEAMQNQVREVRDVAVEKGTETFAKRMMVNTARGAGLIVGAFFSFLPEAHAPAPSREIDYEQMLIDNPEFFEDSITPNDISEPQEDENVNIYMHYSNEEGITGIALSSKILSNSKGKVYLTRHSLSPQEVEDLLFLANPEYKGKGDYVTIFKVDADQEGSIEKVSELESTYNAGTLKIREGNMLYLGSNPNSDVKK